MDDLDRIDTRERRSERQRAIAAQRRRRAMVIGAIAGAVAFLLVAVSVAVAVMASSAPARAEAPDLAVVVTSAGSLDATKAARAAVAVSRSETITVIAVGDLLFDIAPRRLIDAKGGKAPLAKVASYMRRGDLTIANLENPLSDRGTKVAGKPDHLIFRGHPDAVESLAAAGIDVVALANNHTMDYGKVALQDTIATLDKAGVRYAGAGMNVKEAWKPAILDIEGNKVAYLSSTQVLPAHFTAGSSTPGVANGDQVGKMCDAIRKARKKADYVIVSTHWGVEQSYSANSGQVRDARRYVDAGADMVLSHHPHVMQGIEFYKGRLIAYSLGNFVFPYKTVEGRKSFVLKAKLGPKGVTDVTAWPVYLGDYGRPTHQTGASARGILNKLKTSSSKHDTKVIIKGDTARIVPD